MRTQAHVVHPMARFCAARLVWAIGFPAHHLRTLPVPITCRASLCLPPPTLPIRHLSSTLVLPSRPPAAAQAAAQRHAFVNAIGFAARVLAQLPVGAIDATPFGSDS
ncbi:hypothetical protein GSI_04807 [Ganoderma sinense ZZ0214-1]|uniref:Uncharacterized protein n=1 Tax=Ganoderma sinense ZZ0214-1 TaxID=1077348 RepID=A0A2G8SHV8_9APHY|nr:hypothetical protein GSI_04807 [Ganoderma sinense ZZ0214-1]